VLSTTLIARGGGWGGTIPEKKNNAYLLDSTNGATMLTIPMDHALAALREVLGEVAEVSAVLATRRKTALVLDISETLPVCRHPGLADGEQHSRTLSAIRRFLQWTLSGVYARLHDEDSLGAIR
jgi:hypothetical protein